MPAEALDRVFVALADGTRRGVIALLRRGPARAGALATALDVSPPALTRHLRLLRDSGLVEAVDDDVDGRVSVYRLRGEGLAPVQQWIDDVRTMWQRQLASFAAHVGKRSRGKA
jgi:DNA-binding transcriptional ArsR family regulator